MHSIRPRRTWAAALATAGALAVVASPARAQRYELRGDEVAVYTLAGRVELTAGSGSAVVVDVTTGGADGGDLRIETGPIRNAETLRVIFPADEIVYRAESRNDRYHTTLRVRDDGTFGGDRGWRGDRGRRVEISSSGRGFEAYADLSVAVPRGQRITVYVGAGSVSATNVDGDLRLDTHAGGVTTTGTRGTLSVDTGSGTVRVTDAVGDVDIDTGSGGVDATGVEGSSLRIDTGSGSVVASRVTVTDLNIDTGSGRIDVQGASARTVRLDTGSGSVDADLNGAVEDIEVDTGSGSVTLTLPAAFSATVEIESSSGGIDIDFPVEVRRWERDAVRGVIGNGAGRLTVDTGSGSVRIIRGG